MGELKISEEERLRRSEQAKQLHAAGKFGGPQPGSGRPRKKRASERVAEKADEEGDTFFDRLMEIVRGGTDSNAISAISKLIEISEKEASRADRESERIDDMNRAQLLAFVAAHLEELVASGSIPSIGEVIDGTLVEVEDARTSGTRQIPEVSG